MAFNTSFGRTEGWHETDKFQSQLRTKPQSGDFFARLTQSGQEVLSGGNTAALNEVLRQFNEEKSRYQMEMENMKVNIRTNEAMLRQIAEALLGGSFEQAMQKSRKDLERQQQQMDLQAAALREAITHFEDHKATYAIDHADTKRVIDEMREDFSIETKGCIEAASSKVVQECRSSLTEELARIRKEMASLGDELKQKMEEDRSAQDGKVKKMEELHEVVGKKLDDLELRFQQQPDPSTTVNAINAAMVANEKEAAKIQNALEEVSSSAAKMDQQRALFESRVSEAVKSCQDANAGAAKAVEMAQSHSEEAQRATTAVVTAATSAESQAQEAREAVQVLHNVAATAENHAQKAFEAKAAAEQAVETTAGHMLATTNALASVQSNVSSAENYAQAAAEAKAASQVAAESAESCKAAAADALSALQAKVASAESHAQTAFESKSAAERSAEASENHMVAATNALTAVQSNAESVREKTTEVEQHAASVKEIVLQMTEQASALQETTSAVAAASDRAILAVASEADRQVATIEEKLRSSQVAATNAVESESAMCQELENKMQDQKAQIAEVRGNLAECAQITHVLSQKVEAVESQFMAELSSHKEDVMQRFHRHEELTSPKAGEEGVSRARLEEMISTALERTEHLEQSMVGIASEKHSVQFPEEVSRTHAALQAEINDLKTRNASSEARLDELARAEGRLPASPRKVLLRPEELQVRSVPAALCGMVQSALPVPSDTKNRKALIIGCSYYESNNPLSGAFNDAWNVLSLLRHTLQFSESQVRFLVDGSRRCPMPQPRRPTAAVITESLQWLTQDAQSGDAIFLYFAGYGLLLPHGVGTFESCLVPIDYAAMASPPHDTGSGYRLIPLMDVSLALSKLPAGCQATVVLDCCHSSLPGVGSASQPAIFHWAQMQPPAFAGLEEDLPEGFYPKARRLVLPSVPIQTPRSMQAATFNCSLTCFSACQQAQWCAELPIEGVMQGAFTWAWVKATVANGGVIKSPTQMKGSVEAHVADLQKRYRWLDQEPMVQMSKVVEQQELGRIEVPALPSVLQKPLPQGDFRRKALIIGSNYTGSHAQLKGAVNDAWNMYTLLRHALALDDAQVRLLVDGENGAKASPTQVPSKANILMNFQWLMEGAQPGDSLVLVFCGFGTQHPKDHEGKDYEAFLVPSDYAADLPKDWLTQANAPVPPGVPKSVPKAPPGAAYRLISMLELNRFIMQIPAGAALTTILDCSYPALPGVSPSCNIPPTFPKVPRGRVDYDKMFDFVTRPRFLELPPLPVQHTLPQIWKPQTYPTCQLHCFCAGRLQEWPSELPLEGTVQGTFTWAFAKAFAAGELRSTVAQQQQALEGITAQLKQHFQGVEQSPVLMLSQSASSSDSVFA